MKTISAHLQSLPPGTPPGVALYLSGNFNGWQPDDERFRFRLDGDGAYRLDFQVYFDTLEYKITRGNWSTAECNVKVN